jgi:two-component system, chemotaxis family, chemotaxis protein CheY
MRVLIADDQRSFGTALADMVRCCGHEVVGVVGSGLEAIHAYTLHKPDLVLMDHWMPRLNGVTASRHIIAKNPAARVVLLSAWSPLDGADQSGAMCFLPKPVELDRLNATLLTISQTIAPAPGEEIPVSEPEVQSPPSTPVSVVPIPPEIISPIETFPVATFPIEPAVSEEETAAAAGKARQTPVVRRSGSDLAPRTSPAIEKVSRKPRKRRKNRSAAGE